MKIGYNQPLYILPFDHRGSFEHGLYGWSEPLSADQTAQVASAKQIVYEGFLRALELGLNKAKAGILVDEQFGAAILQDARAHGILTACPAEKSGQAEFDFEFGTAFKDHIEKTNPTFSKVLVRYNPEGDALLNERQTARLKILSDYLHSKSRLLMFELLVPAEAEQLKSVAGDQGRYDLELRPNLMVRAIETLQDAGIEPDVWKIEGLDRREDCERMVASATRGGRDDVGCIVLGRGENDAKVGQWLQTAASVPGFIGFAVGRTTFWAALVAWKAGQCSKEEAVEKIAKNYLEWVAVFEHQSSSIQS